MFSKDLSDKLDIVKLDGKKKTGTKKLRKLIQFESVKSGKLTKSFDDCGYLERIKGYMRKCAWFDYFGTVIILAKVLKAAIQMIRAVST